MTDADYTPVGDRPLLIFPAPSPWPEQYSSPRLAAPILRQLDRMRSETLTLCEFRPGGDLLTITWHDGAQLLIYDDGTRIVLAPPRPPSAPACCCACHSKKLEEPVEFDAALTVRILKQHGLRRRSA